VKLIKGLFFAIVLVAFAYGLVLAGVFITMPNGNTSATHFDAIIVLGYPANPDGTPSPEQRERVLEGVREYKAGVAPRIIVSGRAAHNSYVEADVMAHFAESQGVPAGAIFEEPQAQNTIQNMVYSATLMHQHGWSSAEIVSSPSHLPRAAFITNTLNVVRPTLSIDWHTRPAQWPPEYGFGRKFILYFHEAQSCVQLRIHGIPPKSFQPKS
jgi:uncharacterized SAM-binding protein YcdF (DUF218 family)